ncbi:MAG: HEAT repeat domain-containing protein [Candidatus Hydrogenedentota bacterium]|nr:MAG: HEAT repeat domain-containing protein [Candidatus Hydrogenedentota bacterium]
MPNGIPAEISRLIKVLKTGSVEERVRAAHQLAEEDLYGELANPVLIEALGDEADSVRAAAAEALGNPNGTTATPALAKALHDPSTEVRLCAAGALDYLAMINGELTIVKPETVSLIIDALRDEDECVRASAAALLGKMFLIIPDETRVRLEQKALEMLTAMAEDENEDPSVRLNASRSKDRLSAK